MIGSEQTRLVILRGNSGSGKSTTAKELRIRLGRGVAWIEQDYLRRILLREHDVAGGVNIGLIDNAVRYVLDHGYDAIVEGIFPSAHYGEMLRALSEDHAGRTAHYYFDIPFDETIARHSTRALAQKVSAEQMRSWYVERDLLGIADECVIGATSSLDETVSRIMSELSWIRGAGIEPA
ncbi:MAG TPA: AAA family ATPase [Mycobacteriales bacterium]|nr:AAA family ATPase [Mycobacteriales bacterium]